MVRTHTHPWCLLLCACVISWPVLALHCFAPMASQDAQTGMAVTWQFGVLSQIAAMRAGLECVECKVFK